jgi:hypothetical protein
VTFFDYLYYSHEATARFGIGTAHRALVDLAARLHLWPVTGARAAKGFEVIGAGMHACWAAEETCRERNDYEAI